jgi:chromate reductase
MPRRNVFGKMARELFELLGISGSLRRAASSTAVLHSIAVRLPADAAMTIAPLHALPLYNEDEDRAEALQSVDAYKRAVERADGLVVVSPEYNHGMSGVLKNAIDLISRPGYDSVLKNKPVLAISTSNSPLGGVRAQQQLRETFASTLSRVVARRQVVIGQAPKKIVEGVLVDQPTLAFLDDAVGDLLDEISLLRLAANVSFRGSLLRLRHPPSIAAVADQ